ncbi:MAG: hypothetical protein WCX82_03850 [archaeon]|jgi:hypothetical protein
MEPKRNCKNKKTKTSIKGKTLKEPEFYFIDTTIEELYKGLEDSPKFEDKEIYSNLEKAFLKITENPHCGIKIPKYLWPKEYLQKYNITNLYKFDFSNGWRITYTIQGHKIEIISVIIEWFSHKEYERKFKY